MESLNPESLIDAGKRQNKVGDYRTLIEAWHRADVLTHVGYIIGFPHDTSAGVRAQVRALQTELRVDLSSFFMLSPLPGSVDHRRLVDAGTPMDEDLNRYDTFHPVVDHPRMSRVEWLELYREAWRTFYETDYMRRRLLRVSRENYVTLLQMYLWYKAAAEVERFHPMMTGFVRVKPRRERRPGYHIDGRLRHLRRRVPEILGMVGGYARLIGELRRLWLETRSATARGGDSERWTVFLRTMFTRYDPTRGARA
jgi:hypothetical protein